MIKNDKQKIEKTYPVGSTIELIYMDDTHAPPKGTKGTIISIDDIGQIHVQWENGSGLALIPGEDQFKIINKKEERYRIIDDNILLDDKILSKDDILTLLNSQQLTIRNLTEEIKVLRNEKKFTVGLLKSKLKDLPEDMEVQISLSYDNVEHIDYLKDIKRYEDKWITLIGG